MYLAYSVTVGIKTLQATQRQPVKNIIVPNQKELTNFLSLLNTSKGFFLVNVQPIPDYEDYEQFKALLKKANKPEGLVEGKKKKEEKTNENSNS